MKFKPLTFADDEEVICAMSRHGGSFAKALAICAHHADETNRAKIKRLWPELWATYTLFAINAREEEN